MKDETQAEAIVGRFEIAQILGISRQGVSSVIERPDFPAPICKQGKHRAPLFWRRDVEAFVAERKRRELPDQADAALA
jgi:predicted DNA-binding transcriptional regulator AlpA